MNLQAGIRERRIWPGIGLPVLTCVAGAALALTGHPIVFAGAALAVLGYLAFAWISIEEPLVLTIVFLLMLEVLPPFYFSGLGETPIYASFFVLPIVVVVIVMRLQDIRWKWDPVGKGLAAFVVGTGLSIPFAFWLSGTGAGMTSLSRWFLLCHAVLVYYLIRGFSHLSSGGELRIFRLLLFGAVLSAAYGVVDFVWPIPLIHPAADQFIWLEGSVLRRAQGVFYESSNFANFCGFFLAATSAAFLTRKERSFGIPRPLLIVFVSTFSLAVLVAFSRSTWASVITALFVSLLLTRFRLPRGIAILAAILVPLCLLWIVSPGLWDYFVSGRLGRLVEILDDPNSATSGRFDTWVRVLSLLRDNPQYLLFGIGYKTLGVTRLFHGEIITDNGYLSLLLETGLAGLAGFLLWTRSIFKVFLRLTRSVNEVPAFWATVLFSIWCGELVQLLAADATTYWRNLSVFAALMALTLNLVERPERSRNPV